MRSFVLSLLVAVSASAAPVITSISPNTGSVAGGAVITIKGSGFAMCPVCSPPLPPQVLFNNTYAASVVLVDSSTIQATTPALMPGTFGVTVRQYDGSATAPALFTVTGDPSEGFEKILFPIFSPPVDGAFGSRFVTDAHVMTTTEQPVTIYGMFDGCPAGGNDETIPGGTERQLATACSPWPARLLYVAKNQTRSISFNERVTDTTRTASSLGTEIPIVRVSRMTNGKITLLNVPIDSRYRNTLRIYSTKPIVVFVTTVGQPQAVPLQPGANIFEPAFAVFNQFPIPVDPGSTGTMRVTIGQPQDIIAGPPMWAFITVTNNETEQITTISPD